MKKGILRLPYLFKFIWKPPLQRLHFNPVAQSRPSFIFLRACTAAWHFLFAWTDMTSLEVKAAFFLRLARKENAKWSLDWKWSRNWTANDPETQMIPDVARKCTRKPVSWNSFTKWCNISGTDLCQIPTLWHASVNCRPSSTVKFTLCEKCNVNC